MNQSRSNRGAVVAALLAAPCIAAQALDLDLAAKAGVVATNNVFRTATDSRSATLLTAGAEFSAFQATRRLNFDLAGDLQWVRYSDSTFDSEILGDAGLRMDLELAEDRLTWHVEDRFGQTRRELVTVPTPENRENVNFFSTGPNLRLGIADNTRVVVQGRYSRADFEFSNSDIEQVGLQLALERQVNESTLLGLNAVRENVEPARSTEFPEYYRDAAFLRYAKTRGRTLIVFDVGGSRLEGDTLSTSGALLRAEVTRTLTTRSTLAVRVGREFTDAGSSIRQSSGGRVQLADLSAQSVAQTPEPAISRYIEFDWQVVGGRSRYGLASGYFSERYTLTSAFDRARIVTSGYVNYALGSRTEVSARISRSDDSFDTIGADDTQTLLSLGLSRTIGRRLSVSMSIEQFRYTGIERRPIDESRIFVQVRYGNQFSRRATGVQ